MMQCFKPITLSDRVVPCGRCFACQSNRRKEWHMRVKYELLHSCCSYTVTLTYDNEHLPKVVPFYDKDPLEYTYCDNSQVSYMMDSPWKDENVLFWYHPFDIDHVQRFFKRLRKAGLQFRYFGVAEYGGKTARPHYHIIFFFQYPMNKLSFQTLVVKQWPYGCQIVVDDTDDSCIGYTLKYCLKYYNVRQPSPKIFLSKRPFIGAGYLKPETVKKLRHDCTGVIDTVSCKMRIPRLLRDKIFSDDEQELASIRLMSQVDTIKANEQREADRLGIDVFEYRKRLRDSFTRKCVKSLKNKKL